MEPDFCPFHIIKALAFSIIRINITETELTELSNGKRIQRSTVSQVKGETIHPLRRYAPPFGSSVALGSAPLRGHRMTFSHSSKDPLRHPVSGGQSERKTEKRKRNQKSAPLKQGLILIPPAVVNPDLSPNTYDVTKT